MSDACTVTTLPEGDIEGCWDIVVELPEVQTGEALPPPTVEETIEASTTTGVLVEVAPTLPATGTTEALAALPVGILLVAAGMGLRRLANRPQKTWADQELRGDSPPPRTCATRITVVTDRAPGRQGLVRLHSDKRLTRRLAALGLPSRRTHSRTSG